VVKTEKKGSGMKKRHTEEQIIGSLNEARAGTGRKNAGSKPGI